MCRAKPDMTVNADFIWSDWLAVRIRYKRKKYTDAGTVILHWCLAASLALSMLTGLRFAVDMPDTRYLDGLEPFLPVAKIWILHILSGVAVMALAVAYLVYLRSTGLLQRIWPDRARFAALASPGPARWSAVNVLLYWALFACLAGQIVTGVMLHRGYGGLAVDLHLWTTGAILAYTAAHVLAHFLAGGANQLLRVLRPTRIPAPLDSAAMDAAPSPLRGARLFAISAALGALAGALYLYADQASRDVLQVRRVDKAAVAHLGADLWEPVWRDARPLYVHTNQGANFDGAGASLVQIRAVHDGEWIYFAFTWEDPTRSLKHAPLIKTPEGWRALVSQTRAERKARVQTIALTPEDLHGDRSNFDGAINEDKFAVMLSNVEKPFGPGAFHPGAKPLGNKPASSSGRGLHYTEDGSRVNLWLWRAGGADSGRCENNRVGPPTPPTPAQARGLSPYKGGYAVGAQQAVAYDNYTPQLPRDPEMVVQPLRLPLDFAATRAAMGVVDLDPNHGEQETARWQLRESESAPYTPERDALIPIGAMIPGLVAVAPRAPLPSDVLCQARWDAGQWTLLARRRLDTQQGDDIAIDRNTFMWVGAFDHTPANHTRHIRPIRLEVSL